MARRRVPRTWTGEWADLSWRQVFELLWGPSGSHVCPRVEVGDGFACDADELPCMSGFDSEEHRRHVFERHRGLLVDDRCKGGPNSGSRPWVWWRYVVGESKPRDRLDELARLVELDALTSDERAAILSQPRPVDGRPNPEAALLRELTER